MTFNRDARARIGRAVKQTEQSVTPQPRRRWRRQSAMAPGGSSGFWAEITKRHTAGGADQYCYAYAKLVNEASEDAPADAWPRLIKDPDAVDRDDSSHWSDRGAVHLARSKYVPQGTRVWMTRGGPDGRYVFEVTEPFWGIAKFTGTLGSGPFNKDEYLDDLPTLAANRVVLPGSRAPDDPETAIELELSGDANNLVFMAMRGALLQGTVFGATWFRDRYVVTAADPFLTGLSLTSESYA